VGAGGAGAGGAGAGAGGAGAGGRGVSIVGREIHVDGARFHIRGVCWNPVPRGATHPAGLDHAGAAPVAGALMAAARINAVRTYEPITDRAVLDRLHAAGIGVLMTVYVYGGNPADSAVSVVNAVKDHPAILMWVIGNEWNYNGLYVGMSLADSRDRLNAAAALIRAADRTHPIATVYGELPDAALVAAMPEVDVWGINVYRGLHFGDLFAQWQGRSTRPMFIAEYGADAWNALTGRYDPDSQALAVGTLTREISDASTARGGVSSGGTVFEWADEWWKAGNPGAQDTGGTAPGGGPYPDQTFNEEWWGIVDIDRGPRPAYRALADALGAAP
jgi:hypothetical protein